MIVVERRRDGVHISTTYTPETVAELAGLRELYPDIMWQANSVTVAVLPPVLRVVCRKRAPVYRAGHSQSVRVTRTF